MPRTVDEAAHARRRDEFLDAAQRLIGSKGYERMSIQDVLEEAGTSKGALYHYFRSKHELAAGIVERFTEDLGGLLRPIAGERMSALEKLGGIFAQLSVKDARREDLVATMRVWYSGDNSRVRQHSRDAIIDLLDQVLRPVISQGVTEGSFHVTDPDSTSLIVATLIQDVNDYVARHIVAAEETRPAAAEKMIGACSSAIERILGAPQGSVIIADRAALHTWFARPDSEGEPG